MTHDPAPGKTPEAFQILLEALRGDDVATAAYADWLEEQGRGDLADVWRRPEPTRRRKNPVDNAE